jgi:hypothetical protein
MSHLVRQRVKYLMEFGGIYPHEEPATKNFVFKWAVVMCAIQLVDIVMVALRMIVR